MPSCRLTFIVASAVGVTAVAAFFFRRRQRWRASNNNKPKDSNGDATKSAVPGSCPFSQLSVADTAACANLPIVVNSTLLPSTIALGLPLLFPPRHAMVPFIITADDVNDEVAPAARPAVIEQVFVCTEEVVGVLHGCEASKESRGDDEYFRTYLSRACPFFSEGGAAAPAAVSVLPSQLGVFTHIAVSDEYVALLSRQNTLFVTSLLFLGKFDQDLSLATSEVIESSTWRHVAAQCISANDTFSKRRSTELSAPTTVGGGGSRIRASMLLQEPAALQQSQPHGQRKQASVEHTCEFEGVAHVIVHGVRLGTGSEAAPCLVVEDAITGATVETRLHVVAAVTAVNDAVPAPEPALSSPLSNSASSNSARSPLLLPESASLAALTCASASVGVSFSIADGCAVDLVAFEAFPTIRCTWSHNSYETSAIATLQRRTTVPDGWEQAQGAESTTDAFAELMVHNILFLMTPWESRPTQRPRVTETDLCGRRAWVFQEEVDGMRCRTYVCPKLKAVSATSATKATTHVEELLLVRWEAPIAVWESSQVTLRAFLDTIAFSTLATTK